MGQCGRVGGVLAYRLVQQDDGVVILALLRLEKTQHVQGREVRRIGAQHLAIQFLGLIQPAGAMRRHALFE